MFVFCLTSWYMIAALCYEHGGGARHAAIVSYMLYTLLQVVSLEVLSLFNAIGFASLSAFWMGLTALLIG